MEEKCRIEGCKRPYRAKGYCQIHYKKWRHGELPHPRYKICTAEGCRKRRSQWGLCEEHYKAKVGVVEEPKAQPPAEGAPPAEASPPAA